MFSLLKLERGHLFQHYFIADQILYVETFHCFIFIDHMMFLLLKLERGHLFQQYVLADTYLYIEILNWFSFIDHMMFCFWTWSAVTSKFYMLKRLIAFNL